MLVVVGIVALLMTIRGCDFHGERINVDSLLQVLRLSGEMQ